MIARSSCSVPLVWTVPVSRVSLVFSRFILSPPVLCFIIIIIFCCSEHPGISLVNAARMPKDQPPLPPPSRSRHSASRPGWTHLGGGHSPSPSLAGAEHGCSTGLCPPEGGITSPLRFASRRLVFSLPGTSLSWFQHLELRESAIKPPSLALVEPPSSPGCFRRAIEISLLAAAVVVVAGRGSPWQQDLEATA